MDSLRNPSGAGQVPPVGGQVRKSGIRQQADKFWNPPVGGQVLETCLNFFYPLSFNLYPCITLYPFLQPYRGKIFSAVLGKAGIVERCRY
ncbi:MAG TPA: hypothetical protein PLE97_10135 [Tenuifilaceae bacterium]|nr:hypothetical protein [Tenuifilaceae bacterium]